MAHKRRRHRRRARYSSFGELTRNKKIGLGVLALSVLGAGAYFLLKKPVLLSAEGIPNAAGNTTDTEDMLERLAIQEKTKNVQAAANRIVEDAVREAVAEGTVTVKPVKPAIQAALAPVLAAKVKMFQT